jgi:hypothetical protein
LIEEENKNEMLIKEKQLKKEIAAELEPKLKS